MLHNDPSRCVVLVPAQGPVEPGCEDALRALERLGHPVWRGRGYAQVDVARNQLATDALAAGFDELMWVDSDVEFDPAAVARLRGHGRPFVCGVYPKKGPREFACALLPNTRELRFGPAGGLVELLYCGFGFALTRRPVFDAVRERFQLPVCNQRYNRPLVPYFQPMTVADGAGHWYLGEDYAFCERARRCGFPVFADTTVRLWHLGQYRYGWEDAGTGTPRHADYTVRAGPGA